MIKPELYVLMFHGLCRNLPSYSKWMGTKDLIIDTNTFEKTIQWCSKNFEIVDLDGFDAAMNRGQVGKPTILLSFDDGMDSTVELAAPIMERHGVSAVMFTTVDWIDTDEVPAIFAIEQAVAREDSCEVKLRAGAETLTYQMGKRQIHRNLRTLWSDLFAKKIAPVLLSYDDISVNGKSLGSLELSSDSDFWYPSRWDRIQDQVERGNITIGSHLLTHAPISWLDPSEQKNQLIASKAILEKKIGREVKTCAYPHGVSDPISQDLSRSVYQYSFSTRSGTCLNADTACLPRYHVSAVRPWDLSLQLKGGALRMLGAKIGAKISDSLA